MGRNASSVGSSSARGVPGWGVVIAAATPVVLVGGWTLAEARQPPTYDSRTDTISALAADGAIDRWIMTLVFAAIGLCYVLIATAVREPAMPGRIALATGGAATVLVAAFPEPKSGPSDRHGIVATIASSAVAIWPMLAARRGPRVSWPLRPVASAIASLVLIGLLVWFVSELHRRTLIGTSERMAAAAEALWVGLAVAALRRSGVPASGRSARAHRHLPWGNSRTRPAPVVPLSPLILTSPSRSAVSPTPSSTSRSRDRVVGFATGSAAIGQSLRVATRDRPVE
jgi:hypothetical membrane protein